MMYSEILDFHHVEDPQSQAESDAGTTTSSSTTTAAAATTTTAG
jgi:hypothetical protein